MTALTQVIMGFIGSLGFGVLFNVKGKRLIAAAIGGLISWALYIALGYIIPDEAVRYFIVSAVIAVYCEIMARVMKTPTTTFIITSLIPLIPGSGLYYTMTNAFSGDLDEFIIKGLSTLSLAVALALGVIVVTVAFSLINNHIRKKA